MIDCETKMAGVKQLESDRLSTFRTRHNFRHFGEFTTVEEFLEYRSWAKANGLPLYILGNGSNTLFTRRNVDTLVLQNSLKATMNDLGDGRIEASSSMQIMPILKLCEKKGWDSFYFLASVPATVGGAAAMNAGGGVGPTIYEFIESVTFIEGDQLRTLPSDQIERSHRQTMFTGIHDRLIVSVIFKFPQVNLEQSEIRKRIDWALSHQDLKVPNCGSVFKECSRPIIARVRGLPPFGIKVPFFRAQFSRKVNNWIICRNSSSWPIVFLIRMAQAVHRIAGQRAVLEIIEVG
jgi:UDP-N-acetylmuramate dehydrogenase